MSNDDDYVGRTLKDAAATGHAIGAVLIGVFMLGCVITLVTAISGMGTIDAIFTAVICSLFSYRVFTR